MHECFRNVRARGAVLAVVATLGLALSGVSLALADQYPPAVPDPAGQDPIPIDPGRNALVFSATHFYAFGNDPQAVEILVEVFDNCNGNSSFYKWSYTVTNHSYDPNPGITNGFSGFELALPVSVPDIFNILPNGAGWIIDCCSGLMVEWDIKNSGGLGVMPGETRVFSFCTLPRFIAPSGGWFHTWESDVQSWIVGYPPGNEIEVPDVLQPPLSIEADSWGRIKSDYR